MLITLAYPFEGHAPDETVEVADEVGRQMIYDGAARLPDHMAPEPAPQPAPDPAPTNTLVDTGTKDPD